jgi:hypothetical protein
MGVQEACQKGLELIIHHSGTEFVTYIGTKSAFKRDEVGSYAT